jgi:CDGSH-type Zn-finger protein
MAKITVRPNGPLIVDGDDVTVVDVNGHTFEPARRPFGLCRCGASQKKPFCDGSHNKIGFQAPETAEPAKP